jgi:DNA-binding transcriptional LysR family regulator
MELKWLEDFISLAQSRSFSRSAEQRHVTQSAFSRRIQALETWLGVPLVDRSTYPTALTEAGRKFLETAEETVRVLYESRLELQASLRPAAQIVSIAALHTLSISFFPRWFRLIEQHAGPLASKLLADDFHSCVQAVAEGNYDFLLTFHHAQVPILLDPELFPHIVVGYDRLLAVRSPMLAPDSRNAAPLLGYSRTSYLGRLAAIAQREGGVPDGYVVHTSENAMAEALKFMAIEGHGFVWLPRSLVEQELSAGSLVSNGPDVPLEVRLYRSARRKRPAVESLWSAAKTLAARIDANSE